jgi:hypothetical protein
MMVKAGLKAGRLIIARLVPMLTFVLVVGASLARIGGD